MATSWEKAAHVHSRVFPDRYLFVILIISGLGYRDMTLVVIVQVPDHCLLNVVFVIIFALNNETL